MDIRKMTSEELEKLSHLDIAYNIIKNEKKVLNTLDLPSMFANSLSTKWHRVTILYWNRPIVSVLLLNALISFLFSTRSCA